jgi:hypothetical protein
VSVGAFLEWQRESLGMIVKVHRWKRQELEARVRSLEGRYLELEAALAAREAVTHADD